MTMSMPAIQPTASDPALVRRVFSHFPSGVSVIAVEVGGRKHALVASSFMVGVSLEPCLVAVAVQKSSESWPELREADRLGVSIFARGQGGLIRQLGGKDRERRFADVSHGVADSGAVFIDDAALWFECSLFAVHEAGDHWMVLLQVHRIGAAEAEPLVWHGSRFRDLVESDVL
jgi:flavin reductase (DIM6/NTAB) family NADH-FMN oxidoreductase RutF